MGLIKICAFGLGLLGTIMVWQAGGLIAQNSFTNLTVSQLLFDPAFALRVLAGLSAFVAGLAALTESNGASWLTGMASFLLGLIIAILLLNKAVDLDAYRTELIMLILMTCLSLAVVVARTQAALLQEHLRARDLDDTAASLPTA